MNKEAIYWMALAHELPVWSFFNRNGWKNEDKMNLVIQFYHDKKISIEAFFEISEESWKNDFYINDKQIADLRKARASLANYAFLAEKIHNAGIEIIPVISPEYSKTLKKNLKKSSPIILYLKGSKQIMTEKSVAIVGSRKASDIALKFTENIAKLATKEYRVVVSGFAEGVDRKALDASIACGGRGIIVLPQGITTFEAGFKRYYKQIINGDVSVVSIFHPEAGWKKELAMARNPIIYGLAKEIYVAETKFSKNKQGKETKGGTWAGVVDGLKKGRTIYVRQPDTSEKNENHLLFQLEGKGIIIAVDIDGNRIKKQKESIFRECKESIDKDKIKEILKLSPLSIKEIKKKLNTDLTEQKLTIELKKLNFIVVMKEKRKNLFCLENTSSEEWKQYLS
jgi:predicted Rossmann fold nucleotide-binding protein DprA/Smf involved in DNA uptake